MIITSKWTLFGITCAIMISVGYIGIILSDFWLLKILHIINVIFGLTISLFIIHKKGG